MTKNVRARRGGMVILLLGVVLLFLGGVRPAHAQSANCVADFGGVVAATVVQPSVLVAAARRISFCLGVPQQHQTAHGDPDSLNRVGLNSDQRLVVRF